MTKGTDVRPRRVGFLVDATRCINCKTCEVACKDFNGLDAGVRLRRVRTVEGGQFPRIHAYSLSVSCNHCAEPACVEGCPAEAYTQRADGLVIHDPKRCVGCRYCTWVCPYGAPRYDPANGTVRKCNLCVEVLDRGELPECVRACPMRAIEIVDLEPGAPREGATAAVRGLPSPAITQPSCLFVVKPEAVDE